MDMLDYLIIDELDDDELLGYAELCLPDPPEHQKWKRFDLNNFSDEECLRLFRFKQDHLTVLKICLELPEELLVSNSTHH
jgi:hypothetical protein